MNHTPMPSPSSRQTDLRNDIYYWKSDRPSVLGGGVSDIRGSRESLLAQLTTAVNEALGTEGIVLAPGAGQGNHLTFTGHAGGNDYYIRVDDNPEGVSFMDIETAIIRKVGETGVPVPRVFAVDATRKIVPFAWQILEQIRSKDLATLNKTQPLAESELAHAIGAEVAKWQGVKVSGYGPFSTHAWRERGILQGLHKNYPDYFFLQLPRHLQILQDSDLISRSQAHEINQLFRNYGELLNLSDSCLVHKDLAFWNILGEQAKIHAFIDWEDAIGGDPMDDFSLLACFHSGDFIAEALRGYSSVKPLPQEYVRRFWMHLLRNIVMKAVIRQIRGFFAKGDDFFLISKGSDGSRLREFTCSRIGTAMEGLKYESKIETL